jgi:hypothetical protein
VIDPKEGGTCSVTMRFQVHPDVTERGRLTDYLRKEIKGTLDAAEAVVIAEEPPEFAEEAE